MEENSQVMLLRLSNWVIYKKEFVDLKVDNILHNWDACMRLGLSKVKR